MKMYYKIPNELSYITKYIYKIKIKKLSTTS